MTTQPSVVSEHFVRRLSVMFLGCERVHCWLQRRTRSRIRQFWRVQCWELYHHAINLHHYNTDRQHWNAWSRDTSFLWRHQVIFFENSSRSRYFKDLLCQIRPVRGFWSFLVSFLSSIGFGNKCETVVVLNKSLR